MPGSNRSFNARWLLTVVAPPLVAALMCGAAIRCGSKKTKTTSLPSTQASQSSAPSSAGPAGPILLSGGGSEATEQFTLAQGVAVSQMTYSGGTRFRAEMLDASGQVVDVLADVTSNLTGSTATGVSAGKYSVNVTAVGAWEIDIVQSMPQVVPFTPLAFTGTQPVATPYFQSSGKNTNFTMNFTGTLKFTVKLLNSTGQTVQVIADVTGPYNATAVVPLASGVRYLIDVEAAGAWTINVN